MIGGSGDPPPIVVDSVYDSYCFRKSFSILEYGLLPQTNVTFVNSVSKNFGAPGLRIGWLAGHRRLVRDLTLRQEYEAIAVSGPSQAAAARLISAGNSQLIATVVDGRSQVQSWWATRDRAQPLMIDGGTQATIPVPAATDPEQVVDDLMTRFRVVVSSSANYCGADVPFLRVPLGVPRHRLRSILEAYDHVSAAAEVTEAVNPS